MKDEATLATVAWMLQARAIAGKNQLGAVRWVLIQQMSEAEVAEVYRDSLCFIFLSVIEGCPLMPLEAMLSGCLVSALDGGAASDYLPEEYLFERKDLRGLVTEIEDRFARYHARDASLLHLAEKGASIGKRFSLEREEQSVVSTWKQILTAEHG